MCAEVGTDWRSGAIAGGKGPGAHPLARPGASASGGRRPRAGPEVGRRGPGSRALRRDAHEEGRGGHLRRAAGGAPGAEGPVTGRVRPRAQV